MSNQTYCRATELAEGRKVAKGKNRVAENPTRSNRRPKPFHQRPTGHSSGRSVIRDGEVSQYNDTPPSRPWDEEDIPPTMYFSPLSEAERGDDLEVGSGDEPANPFLPPFASCSQWVAEQDSAQSDEDEHELSSPCADDGEAELTFESLRRARKRARLRESRLHLVEEVPSGTSSAERGAVSPQQQRGEEPSCSPPDHDRTAAHQHRAEEPFGSSFDGGYHRRGSEPPRMMDRTPSIASDTLSAYSVHSPTYADTELPYENRKLNEELARLKGNGSKEGNTLVIQSTQIQSITSLSKSSVRTLGDKLKTMKNNGKVIENRMDFFSTEVQSTIDFLFRLARRPSYGLRSSSTSWSNSSMIRTPKTYSLRGRSWKILNELRGVSATSGTG